MKICKNCNQKLEITDFPKNKNKKDGLSVYCKRCCSKRTLECRYRKQGLNLPYKEIRPNKKHNLPYKSNTPEYRKHHHLVNNYSITLEDYNIMVVGQKGQCLICKKSDEVLCVDHDHVTGQIRGLLCVSCNAGIGYFQEKSDLLLKAITYLSMHKV